MPSATLHQHLVEARAVRPGEHMWVLIAAFEVSPESLGPGVAVGVRQDSLLALSPPGCFVCEQEFDPVIAELPCPGARDA